MCSPVDSSSSLPEASGRVGASLQVEAIRRREKLRRDRPWWLDVLRMKPRVKREILRPQLWGQRLGTRRRRFSYENGAHGRAFLSTNSFIGTQDAVPWESRSSHAAKQAERRLFELLCWLKSLRGTMTLTQGASTPLEKYG